MPAPNEPRYKKYGLFDAVTGDQVGKPFPTRAAAKAAKNAHPRIHELRVRGIK